MKDDFLILQSKELPIKLSNEYSLIENIGTFKIFAKNKEFNSIFKSNDYWVISKTLLFGHENKKNSILLNQYFLELFLKKKENFAEDLVGKFAVIILDIKNNGIILCSDHLAHYPIYFNSNNGGFVASTELRPLTFFVQKELDLNILNDHLVQNTPRKGRTLYKDIDVQAPGTYSRFYKSQLTKFCYHRYEYKEEKNFSSEEFKDLFLRVISEQIEAVEKPVSFSLSGGIDSSSIVCSAFKASESKLITHSAVFPDSKSDESFFINKVLKHVQSEHFSYSWRNFDYLEQLERSSNFDEIAFGASTYINHEIYRNTVNHGNRAHFEGIYGDEVISHGYDRLIDLGLSFNFFELFNQEKKLRRNKNIKFSYARSLKDNLLRPLMPISLQRLFFEEKRITNIFPWLEIKNEDFKFNPVDHFISINGYHPFLKDFRSYGSNHEKSLNSAIMSYSARLYNNIGKSYGLELMSPFSDVRVMSYLLNIPTEKKLNNGYERFFFREAMKDILPEQIRQRKRKADLSTLFYKEASKITREDAEDKVFFKGSPLDNIVDKTRFLDYFKGDNLHNSKIKLNNIHTLLVLGSWIKKKFH